MTKNTTAEADLGWYRDLMLSYSPEKAIELGEIASKELELVEKYAGSGYAPKHFSVEELRIMREVGLVRLDEKRAAQIAGDDRSRRVGKGRRGRGHSGTRRNSLRVASQIRVSMQG